MCVVNGTQGSLYVCESVPLKVHFGSKIRVRGKRPVPELLRQSVAGWRRISTGQDV